MCLLKDVLKDKNTKKCVGIDMFVGVNCNVPKS